VLLAPPLLANARRPVAPSIAWDQFMSINTNPVSEAAIRILMRDRRIDRATAIQIYLKERLEALS